MNNNTNKIPTYDHKKVGYYKSEDQFMLSVDCIIFGFDENGLKLLLFKRRVEPFRNSWSLIGSFMRSSESVPQAANRVLKESTGLDGVFMTELGSFSHPNRDPGGRVISIAHFALIRLGEQEQHLSEEYHARWFAVTDMPVLILDHSLMVAQALIKLKWQTKIQPIGFELLPEKFTIPQLRFLYESINQRDLDKRNFRKKILSMQILEKLDQKDKTTSKKGAFLYRFDTDKYKRFKEEGIVFEI